MIPITVVLLLLLGVFIAVQIGSDNVIGVLVPVIIIAGLVYVVFLSRFTWQISLFFCYLALSFRPLGFAFSATEITCGLGALLAVITFWQKRSLKRTGVLRHHSFNLLRLLLLIWIVYVTLHMIYNIKNPFRPGEFALTNALKSYFEPFAPAVMLLYFSGNPAGIQARGNVLRTLGKIMFVTLVFSLAVNCYGILGHRSLIDPDNENSDFGTILFIPGINAMDNPFILRTLGPAAILLGAIAWYLGSRTTGVSRLLSISLISLGFLGTILSGGRATIEISVTLVVAMLVLRKQILSLVLLLAAAGFFILSANVASDWINRNAPALIARPLQLVMVTKNKEAFESIQSSTRWREELFDMTIAEWRSNPRIFWFGRATYGFGVSDLIAQQIKGGYESGKESSLRRGATHNLISDLLIAYGLVGCILYYCVILAIIRFLWTVYRSPEVPQLATQLSLFCFLSSIGYLVYATVGGGYYPIDAVWLLLVLIAVLYRHRPIKAAEEPAIGSIELLESRAA